MSDRTTEKEKTKKKKLNNFHIEMLVEKFIRFRLILLPLTMAQ